MHFVYFRRYYFIFTTTIILIFVGLYYLRAENKTSNPYNSEFSKFFACNSYEISPSTIGKVKIPNPERDYLEKYSKNNANPTSETIYSINEPVYPPVTDIIPEETIVVEESNKNIYLPIMNNPSPGRTNCGPASEKNVIVKGYVKVTLNSPHVTSIIPISDAAMRIKTLSRDNSGRFLGLATMPQKTLNALVYFEPGRGWSTRKIIAPFAKSYPYDDFYTKAILSLPNDNIGLCVEDRTKQAWELLIFNPNLEKINAFEKPFNPYPEKWDEIDTSIADQMTGEELYPLHEFDAVKFEKEIARISLEGINRYKNNKNPEGFIEKYTGKRVSTLTPPKDIKRIVENDVFLNKIKMGKANLSVTALWEKLSGTNRTDYIRYIKKYWYRNFLNGRGYEFYPNVTSKITIAEFPVEEDRQGQLWNVSLANFRQFLNDPNNEYKDLLAVLPEDWLDTFKASILINSQNGSFSFTKNEIDWLETIQKIFLENFIQLDNSNNLKSILKEKYMEVVNSRNLNPELSCFSDDEGKIYVQSGINPVTEVFDSQGTFVNRIYDKTDPDLACLYGARTCIQKASYTNLQDRLYSVLIAKEKENRRFSAITLNKSGYLLRNSKSMDLENSLEGFDERGELIFKDLVLGKDMTLLMSSGPVPDHFYFLVTEDNDLKSDYNQYGYKILQCDIKPTSMNLTKTYP